MKLLTSTVALCIGLTLASGAKAALVPAMGGQALNDTDLNVTWLANANLAATNTFGVSGIAANGSMTWSTAQSWVAAMNTANYLGYNDWRLPTTLQPDASCSAQAVANGVSESAGYNCTGSEMGHLFYSELGGMANQSITTTHNANYNLFQNVQSNIYWSSTQYTNGVWIFDFSGGGEIATSKSGTFNALAVRGQVAAVPVPAAAWLMGSGLMGLIGVTRRKAA